MSDTTHKGFQHDEETYWAMRDELLAKYEGKWVAVHNGRVTAVGNNLLEVVQAGCQEDGYGYCNCVGKEDKIVVMKRRVQFPYDDTYSPTPLPRIRVGFSDVTQTARQVFDDVIPDTGADLTCLPQTDYQALGVLNLPVFSGTTRAFGGVGHGATFYQGIAEVDGKQFVAIIEPTAEAERLLGRDVLNQLRATFDGPASTTTLEAS